MFAWWGHNQTPVEWSEVSLPTRSGPLGLCGCVSRPDLEHLHEDGGAMHAAFSYLQGASDLFGGSGPLAKHAAAQCILSQIFLRPVHESQAFPGTGSGVSCQDSWCWPRGPQLGPTCEVCALRPLSNSEDLCMSSGCSGKSLPFGGPSPAVQPWGLEGQPQPSRE